jgi:glycosyltransferase involved in cell wall biosynthesis
MNGLTRGILDNLTISRSYNSDKERGDGTNMRIGMMADAYKPHISGITNYISLNKRYLEALGHEVFVFTFGGEVQEEDDEKNIIRTRGMPLVDSGYYISVRYNDEAQRILQTMDIVHVHHPFTSGQLALRYCKASNIPIVFTNHTRYDLYAQVYIPIVPEAMWDAFLKAYMPSFCRSCDLVIAPSAGLKEVLNKLNVDSNIEVVPNGIEVEPFQTPADRIPRSTFNIGEEAILLTYMGRLGPEKNLSFLMQSFSAIAKSFNGVHLIFIGGGAERQNLEEQARYLDISDKVHFTGQVPYENLPSYQVSADVFVTASISEVHPLSLIESMAAGLPAVGIQSPGIGDIIEDGVNGLLAPTQDLAIFTAKIARIVSDHEYRHQLAANARESAKLYSISRTANIMLSHYDRLVTQAKKKKRKFRINFRRIFRKEG